MLQLPLNGSGKPARVLCLGAHCDDLEIGCGGTVMQLVAAQPDIEIDWVIFSSNPRREQEARASAADFLAGSARSGIDIRQFRNGYFPYIGTEIKDCFEQLKSTANPDLILTHWREDMHQDHRLIGELTCNTFRNHLVLEYEIPKFDGDLGRPNTFVSISDEIRRKKVELILRHFPSQADKQWFCAETFNGLMRLRGVECNAATGYAEAFHCRKLAIAP